jgi:hypothetical protein
MEPDSTPPEQPPKRLRRFRPQPGVDPFPGELKGRGCGPGHLKVEDVLTPEDRDAYYAFLRLPSTTQRSAGKWLRGHGYKVGQTAVRNHLVQFRRRLAVVKQSAEMSYACGELTRQTGSPVLSDGAVARFETLLSQALFDLEMGGKLKREEWDMLGRALTNAVSNRTKLEELRHTFEEAKRAAAGAAESAAREGADGRTVVERVKEILGV